MTERKGRVGGQGSLAKGKKKELEGGKPTKEERRWSSKVNGDESEREEKKKQYGRDNGYKS